MTKLTPEGEKIVAALAEQYKIGADAVKTMLDAVAKGGGSMAQFNVPELGGVGQWMPGGMTMTGDMFNAAMKPAVDNLCSELSKMLDNQAAFFAAPVQSQSQSQGSAASPAPRTPGAGDAGAILSLIEQLAVLRDKDILTEEEFAAKKAELLKRL